MTVETTIRAVRADDEVSWRVLWDGYNRFYGVAVPEDVTDATWQRVLDPGTDLIGRVAEQGGAVIGFSTSVLHSSTWAVAPVCYLEDLFVDPERRGTGTGRLLIADLLRLRAENGWSGLYWHTQSSNPARRLYDEFTTADDFVRYRIRD